ncbi:hypothetical protein [Ekhidna sp.]|uniref:hypothetical protein n=1 Tax=Ekhidna sp. TaxID=2608089 RepID=UPI00329900FF
MKWITLAVAIILVPFCSFSQNFYDSYIAELKVDTIDGYVPTFYTPGSYTIALELQQTISDAIRFYEKESLDQFDIKLAVLDSAQWPSERVPFGYVFYSSGWIFMNTGMTYDNFKNVYGLADIYEQIDLDLKKSGISPSQMIQSFYVVYSIHELGHYFISQISNAKSPDRWTNEFIATYFSYNFFKKYSESSLREFELFHRVHKDFYQPKYSTIADFNDVYMGMGVENYVWYHSNFYFLVDALYKCYGSDFISTFEEMFPKNEQSVYEISEIIQLLDKNCNKAVENWVKALEAVTVK